MFVMMKILAGAGPLGSSVARHFILRGRELRFPLVVGFGDFGHGSVSLGSFGITEV
jgi:hypothetical protein